MIYEELYDWQKRMVDDIMDKRSYGIFLDMGCGKTPISLALAEQHKCTKMIIITINSKALEDENVKGSFLWWANKSSIHYNYYNKKHNFDKTGPKKYQATISPNTQDVLIINYEGLFDRSKKSDIRNTLKDFARSCRGNDVALILDESHKIKDTSSLQTKAVMRLKDCVNQWCDKLYTYLLTGTPFTRGFVDIYSQLKILGCPMYKKDFLEKFCVRAHIPTLPAYAQPVVGYRNIDELYQLIHSYAITIKTEEVVKYLPEQIFVKHTLPMSKEFLLYTAEKLKVDMINKELKSRGEDEIESGERGGRVNNPFYRNIAYPSENWIAETSGAFWMRARQLSIGFQGNEEEAMWFNKDRLDALKKLLEQNEDNYLLFYNYTPEFLELYELCDELGYKIDVYNGQLKSLKFYEEYQNMSDSDKLVEKKRIILANFASGSTGVNWQDYNKCIIFSLPIFRDWQQGVKRIHRLGQKNTCVYHIFESENWLDAGMNEALTSQKDYDSSMFMSDLQRVQSLIGEN